MLSGAIHAQAARKQYVEAIQLLVDLASLQTAFLTLDEAIKTTNRRVNALDSVVRPRLENTISYIKVRGKPEPWAPHQGVKSCRLIRLQGEAIPAAVPLVRGRLTVYLGNWFMSFRTCSCVEQGELDELEREEFFRLKKVQKKKKRDEELRLEAAMAQVPHYLSALALSSLPIGLKMEGVFVHSAAEFRGECACSHVNGLRRRRMGRRRAMGAPAWQLAERRTATSSSSYVCLRQSDFGRPF